MNPKLSDWIFLKLKNFGIELPRDFKKLSQQVIQLSTYFQQPIKTTPWDRSPAAYLAYFFPYNYLRIQHVLKETPPQIFDQVFEVGSGAGNFQLALFESGIDCDYGVIEKSNTAFELHNDLCDFFNIKRPQRLKKIPNSGCGIFSYSINEIETPHLRSNHFLIIEPSQTDQSRRLMAWRKQLIESGYSILAPCTHQQDCPLLIHSKTDFCHDRFFPDRPDWLIELESYMPIKNRSLTHSYLIGSKILKNSTEHHARVIGDTLFENGKVRQAICRDSNREFISVLTKIKKDFVGFPHGNLIPDFRNTEMKGNEIRLDKAALDKLSEPLTHPK